MARPDLITGLTGLPPDIKHTDGVPWWEAPLPHRFHRCAVQTSGWIGLQQWWRCACGAIRMANKGDSRKWKERNQRRKDGDR